MNTHTCIKCKSSYEDNEVDPYYCNSCNIERKSIAATIDAKIASRPRKEVKSIFSAKDFIGNGRIMFNVRDL